MRYPKSYLLFLTALTMTLILAWQYRQQFAGPVLMEQVISLIFAIVARHFLWTKQSLFVDTRPSRELQQMKTVLVFGEELQDQGQKIAQEKHILKMLATKEMSISLVLYSQWAFFSWWFRFNYFPQHWPNTQSSMVNWGVQAVCIYLLLNSAFLGHYLLLLTVATTGLLLNISSQTEQNWPQLFLFAALYFSALVLYRQIKGEVLIVFDGAGNLQVEETRESARREWWEIFSVGFRRWIAPFLVFSILLTILVKFFPEKTIGDLKPGHHIKSLVDSNSRVQKRMAESLAKGLVNGVFNGSRGGSPSGTSDDLYAESSGGDADDSSFMTGDSEGDPQSDGQNTAEKISDSVVGSTSSTEASPEVLPGESGTANSRSSAPHALTSRQGQGKLQGQKNFNSGDVQMPQMQSSGKAFHQNGLSANAKENGSIPEENGDGGLGLSSASSSNYESFNGKTAAEKSRTSSKNAKIQTGVGSVDGSKAETQGAPGDATSAPGKTAKQSAQESSRGSEMGEGSLSNSGVDSRLAKSYSKNSLSEKLGSEKRNISHPSTGKIGQLSKREKIQRLTEKIEKLLRFVTLALGLAAGLTVLYFLFQFFMKLTRSARPRLMKKVQPNRKDRVHLQKLLHSLSSIQMSPEQEVISSYNVLLEIFEAVQFKREQHVTPQKFLEQVSVRFPQISAFFSGTTETFSEVLYGRKSLKESELLKFRRDMKHLFSFFGF